MSEFCPDGYETTRKGIARAAQRWFAKQFEASESEVKPQDAVQRAVRAFSSPQVPEEWRQIATQTVHRLRNLLHQGKLNAYYFDNDGRHSVLRDFWVLAQADGVLETGIYWPFGQPSRNFEMRPRHPLFLRETELDGLLSEQPAEQRHLPRSEFPNLVQALGTLDHLPNRQAQFQALRHLPQFRGYKITHADFREAARRLPREPGQRSRRQS